MSKIHNDSNIMTPHISPKDVPQNTSDSDTEEDHVVTNISHDSSSSEDDDGDVVNEISGYVPLSTNDGNDDNNDNHIQMIDGHSNGLESSESHQETPQSINATSDSVYTCTSISGTCSTEETQISMDNDQIKLIQQVMSNISLPSSSIPEWAKVVPEDRWKNSLLTSLENRNNSKSEPETADYNE